MLEDAAYRRLIDAYYTREQSLPAEKKACYRLVRAQSKEEREAVDTVLGEFFDLLDDGWHQKRCDEEIARYLKRKGNHWAKRLSRAQRAALQAIRHARRLHATPPWLTAAHKSQIVEIYERARRVSVETGVAQHVDHIVPLRGESVCGLHVPWNLQVIPAYQNIRKSNSEVFT
jgi:uncharacterized protein YdaU (DUF1376 family)